MAVLNIVIPVYNEAESIPFLYDRLKTVINQLEYDNEVIFVDDGSTDETSSIISNLIRNEDNRITLIRFSRNFGHQYAITAGLDYAEGDVVITMDGDGQHPPELIPELLKLYESGSDLVLTQRIGDEKVGLFKKFTSKVFYKLINYLGETELTPASADFRLQSRKVVLAIRQMREQLRFLRGMFAWMGFSTSVLQFNPPERIGGVTKYSIKKMINLARNAIFSFSLVPMRLSIITGVIFFLGALVQAIYVLSFWFTGNQDKLTPGWSSLLFIILIIGGLLFVQVGLIGYYIGFIFQEVKNRPLYLISEIIDKRNIDSSLE